MKRWLETQGYVLCFTLAGLRVNRGWPVTWLENIWTGIWYHFYCPYPTLGNWSARSCANADCCGCSNRARFQSPQDKNEVRQDG